jgi:predicted PilT family ATPase
MREALAQAQRGRLHILDKMEEVITTGREKISDFAPRFYTLQIPVDKIRDLIGPGGKMIRSIVEQTGVKIDVEDSGQGECGVERSGIGGEGAADYRRHDGDGGSREDVSRQSDAAGGFRRVRRDHSRHRWVAAHQRSGGASHCKMSATS